MNGFFGATTDLSILSAMITPAVLILASSQLVVATSQRLSRVIDRSRQLNEELMDLHPEDSKHKVRHHLTHVLGLTLNRSLLLQRSMVCLYIAMFLFITVSLSIGIIDTGNFKSEWLPVLLGISGVALLLIASIILIVEANLSLKSTRVEASFIRSLNRELRIKRKEISRHSVQDSGSIEEIHPH